MPVMDVESMPARFPNDDFRFTCSKVMEERKEGKKEGRLYRKVVMLRKVVKE
jgi:hypothetical protein